VIGDTTTVHKKELRKTSVDQKEAGRAFYSSLCLLFLLFGRTSTLENRGQTKEGTRRHRHFQVLSLSLSLSLSITCLLNKSHAADK